MNIIVNDDGDMVRQEYYWRLVTRKPFRDFNGEMRIEDIHQSNHSNYISLIRKSNGKRYYISASALIDYFTAGGECVNATINGRWTLTKRGSAYSLKSVEVFPIKKDI